MSTISLYNLLCIHLCNRLPNRLCTMNEQLLYAITEIILFIQSQKIKQQ